MLNSDYFIIHSAQDRSLSRASTAREGSLGNRNSIRQLSRHEIEDSLPRDIQDIGSLMKALRLSRIDREKMEAVEDFIKHGGDELYYLRGKMRDIMAQFIFQASRRLLLSHLTKLFDEASDGTKAIHDDGKGDESCRRRRLENLRAAVKAADDEVKSLEFWSDVKDMAEKGETQGAVDESQGWDESWMGLDVSGPRDVISARDMPGASCESDAEIGEVTTPNVEGWKGKAIG